MPTDFCNCGQYPIIADTTCCGSPDSVFYGVTNAGGTAFPFLTEWGTIGLMLILLVIASWVFFKRRKLWE